MPKLKILIAEDSSPTQLLYLKALPDSLFEKQIVEDGEECLDVYSVWKPDIILLDINMPIMNGCQTLRAIRDKKNDKSTTIIMISSSSEKNDIVDCARLGIQGYIVKPFKREELSLKIMEYHKNK